MQVLGIRDGRCTAELGIAGGVAKDINQILVSTWRVLQNRRIFRGAEFFATDQRLVVATLELRVKSKKPPRCDDTTFHLEKLKDLTCAQEYEISNRFGVLDTLRNPVELWDTFESEILEAAKKFIGAHPKSQNCLTSV